MKLFLNFFRIISSSILLFLFIIFNYSYSQSVEELKAQLKVETDSLELSSIHSEIALFYFDNGDLVTSLDHFFKSLNIVESIGNLNEVAKLYNNIATVNNHFEKYNQAELYAKKAIDLLHESTDTLQLANALSTLGNIYYMQMKDSLCLHFYEESIKYRKMLKDSVGLVTLYKNIGALYHEMSDTVKGIEYIEKSLLFIKSTNDKTLWFETYLSLAEIYLYSGNLDKGRVYIDSCSTLLPLITSFEMIDDYYYALYFYYKKKGDFEQALDNYKLFESYKDSVASIQKHNQITELNLKYETEKKDEQIIYQNNLLKKEQRVNNLILIISIIIIVFFGLLIIVFRVLQKYKLQRLEKEHNETILTQIINTEEKERNRIARDLHDGIVQDLMALRFDVATIQQKSPDDLHPSYTKLNEGLSKISNEVREISYQMMPVTLKELGLLKAIEELLNRNLNHNKIMFEFNSFEIEESQLSEKIKVTVYRICQELINNTLKHSNANRVSLLLQVHNNTLQLTFEDNGVGFDSKNVQKGMGLYNLNNRIAWIKGSLEFESSELTSGTTAFIRIPL